MSAATWHEQWGEMNEDFMVVAHTGRIVGAEVRPIDGPAAHKCGVAPCPTGLVDPHPLTADCLVHFVAAPAPTEQPVTVARPYSPEGGAGQ